MEVSRQEAIEKVQAFPKERRNQEAIVKIMQNIDGIERKVWEIPGGAKLHELEDEESLPLAIFSWLKGFPVYERLEISFVGDYESLDELKTVGLKPIKRKVQDFNYHPKEKKFWETKGFRTMSTLLAKYLNDSKYVTISVIVEKDGLYHVYDNSNTFNPEHEKFNPTLIIHRINKH